MVSVQGHEYEVIQDVKNGWMEEEFKKRYSEILHKYDYIVGDWGYNQLRLRGFFDDYSRKAKHDTKISTLAEYVYEYCNFGCAYFVVQKVKEEEKGPSH